MMLQCISNTVILNRILFLRYSCANKCNGIFLCVWYFRKFPLHWTNVTKIVLSSLLNIQDTRVERKSSHTWGVITSFYEKKRIWIRTQIEEVSKLWIYFLRVLYTLRKSSVNKPIFLHCLKTISSMCSTEGSTF